LREVCGNLLAFGLGLLVDRPETDFRFAVFHGISGKLIDYGRGGGIGYVFLS